MNHPIQKSKRFIPKSLKFGSAALCLSSVLMANFARAAVDYWDPQGTTGSNPFTGSMTGTWENSSWSTASGGTASPTGWVETDAAVFGVHTGIGTPPFTVTMNANHEIAGVFDGPLAPNSCSVTINGTGLWQLANAQGFSTVNASDGSLANVIIDVPIVDGSYASATTGQIVTEGTSGQLYLNAANTYSGGSFGIGNGGTLLGYASANWTAIVNFNNNQSFGTGSIVLMRGISTGFGALVAENSGININNALDFSQAVSTAPYLNIVGASAVSGGTTFSGNVNLGANAVHLGSGGTGNLVTLSGVISGTGSLTKFNGSILKLTGNNTFTGPTTVSGGTLLLGAANTISSSSTVVMNGGTLDLGGFAHAMTGGLGLTASSIIDFEVGGSSASFINSSLLGWTGILNLANWSALDTLQVGTDATGLTTAQLAEIEFNGTDLGHAQILANGDIVDAPEPSSILLGLLGGLGMMWTIRRRKA
jgi:fibronectin-binding autotransporter adhesin